VSTYVNLEPHGKSRLSAATSEPSFTNFFHIHICLHKVRIYVEIVPNVILFLYHLLRFIVKDQYCMYIFQ